MITINLLPEELKKAKIKIELPKLPIIPITATVIAVAVLLKVLLNLGIMYAKNKVNELDKAWEVLIPDKSKYGDLKKQIDVTEKKVNTIEYLLSKRLSWARLLNALSDSLTPNVWLSGLSYDQTVETRSSRANEPKRSKDLSRGRVENRVNRVKMATLDIQGSARGKGEEATTNIASFIRSLKSNKDFFRYFDDIELGTIRSGVVKDQDVMNFDLRCKFRSEEI